MVIGGIEITVAKVYCLPSKVSEEKLNEMYETIKEKVAGTEELETTPGEITVLFIPDMMKLGLGNEIIVEIAKRLDKPNITPQVLNNLAEKVGKALITVTSPSNGWKWKVPKFIEVSVSIFNNPRIKGLWSCKV